HIHTHTHTHTQTHLAHLAYTEVLYSPRPHTHTDTHTNTHTLEGLLSLPHNSMEKPLRKMQQLMTWPFKRKSMMATLLQSLLFICKNTHSPPRTHTRTHTMTTSSEIHGYLSQSMFTTSKTLCNYCIFCRYLDTLFKTVSVQNQTKC